MVLTIRKCGSGGYTDKTMPEQLKLLTKFYNEHYKPLTINEEVIYYDKLNYVLAYEAIDIVKNINVNISEHFIQHLHKFININLGRIPASSLTVVIPAHFIGSIFGTICFYTIIPFKPSKVNFLLFSIFLFKTDYLSLGF